jgi:hypothetical protein
MLARADSAPITSKLVDKIAVQFIMLLDFSNKATPINCLLCLQALARAESRCHNANSVLL